jgi:outer membrane protein assembly factor BamE (lipoprotein component of BamABCDE complex)
MYELKKNGLVKPLGLLAILLAACAILGFAVNAWNERPQAVTPDEWIQLERGMTSAEVRELLGEPLGIASSGADGESWEYDLADTTATYAVFLRFEDGSYVGLDTPP